MGALRAYSRNSSGVSPTSLGLRPSRGVKGHKPSPTYKASSAGWALSESFSPPSTRLPSDHLLPEFWVSESGPRPSSTTGEPQCPLQPRLQAQAVMRTSGGVRGFWIENSQGKEPREEGGVEPGQHVCTLASIMILWDGGEEDRRGPTA